MVIRAGMLALLFGGFGLAREVGRTGGVIDLAVSRRARALVPAGAFRMGSDEADIAAVELLCLRVDGDDQSCGGENFLLEMPMREVTLPAFRIDRTEVTVGAYVRCVQAGVCASPMEFPGDHRFDGPTQPVVGVSWEDAHDYCAWAGGRLPSEAEWERAARGQSGRTFPWGRTWNPSLSNHGRYDRGDHATDDHDGFRFTAPVGSFPDGASPYGLLDMAGNAAEWVEDYFTEYDAAPTSPRIYRVIRGGSWTFPAPWQRSAARNAAAPTHRSMDTGFRCAQDVR